MAIFNSYVKLPEGKIQKKHRSKMFKVSMSKPSSIPHHPSLWAGEALE
jgi:hypothetical protein